MKISLIAAVADNGVIGDGKQMPWHLPRDLARFKRLTMGHHLVLGRKTFESIGKPLPGRKMIVLSRDASLTLPPEVRVLPSFEAAVELAQGASEEELFVAGGAQIYRYTLPLADRFYLTLVHGKPAGDVHFPAYDRSVWKLLEREHYPEDDRHRYALTFKLFERR